MLHRTCKDCGELLENCECISIAMEKKSGTKYDNGKPELSLLPRGGLEECAKAMMFGKNKYSRDNWRGGFEDSRLVDASLRHIVAYMNGERCDNESGYSHIGHAIFGLMVLAEQNRLRANGVSVGVDDIYKSE